ncbi:hypothetical protein [Metallosphaera sp.]|uniref:hypothetical protein n=1 Tax=Metallosphaera sp. TaxID=2020860 RepID=UPI00315E5727
MSKKDKPEVLEDLEDERDTKEIVDLEEAVNLRDLVGKVLILESAEIVQGNTYNVTRLYFKEATAYTTSKSVENTVRQLLERGLGQDKSFRVCVTKQPSKYKTEMLMLTSPSMCEKNSS